MSEASAPVTIAVTGGIGSGKSTFARMLGDLGAAVFSSDDAVHELYRQPDVRKSLVERWGSSVITPNNEVDRRAVASIVFSDASELRWLESVVHPMVAGKWLQFLDDTTAKVVVAEVPLLFEKNLEDRYDLSVLVTADRQQKETRLVERGDHEDASDRMAEQLDDSVKAVRADLVVDNSGSLADLAEQARKIMQVAENVS